jgi:hypothetical protein
VLRFAQVLVSNQIYIFGYPVSVGIVNAPQIDITVHFCALASSRV